MTDFNDPFEREKLFKKRKGLLDLLKERTRIANLDGRTPKKYNRFEQEIGGVDIEQYYQSGDPIGKRNNPVKPGAREQHDDPGNPIVNTPLQVRVYTSIKQSDGRVIDLTRSFTDSGDSYANALKQRVALWSASSADSYDTVYVQYRPSYGITSTFRTQYTTDDLESERSQQYYDSEGNEIAKRGGSAFYTDEEFTTTYQFSSLNFSWVLLERLDTGAFFIALYSNGVLFDQTYSGYSPPTPATASIFDIDDGAGNIVNDGSDGFDIGYLAVDLVRVRTFDRVSNGDEINLFLDSATSSLQPAEFKCITHLDDYESGKSGFAYYGILTTELPLQTGSADAGTIIRSVRSNAGSSTDNYWGPATSFDGTWAMYGDRSDLQEDGTNSEAVYIISASDGVVHEIYRIDDKTSNTGVKTVNDGSDGLLACPLNPTVTTTTYRSFFETRVHLSSSQFKFEFSDPYGYGIDTSSFTLTNNAHLSSSFSNDSTAYAIVTSSLATGSYSYTGSISNTNGNTTTFSSSFEIFSGSLISFYAHTSINHSASDGSGSIRYLQSPIWDMSGSQFKEYVAGFVGNNGGNSNTYIEASHIPIIATDQFYQGDLDFETTGRTKLIEEPTSGDLLIISGTSGGGFDVPGNKDHAVVYRVGNTGSTPPITRDGSDGLPVLTEW